MIELLIVTVVIVTLMGIVFRLAGAGSDSSRKASTISRLQCLENAVSGYYAAYGSYPPVPLEGRSRDISVRVDRNGVQGDPKNDTRDVDLENPKTDDMKQIEAACRAQPVAVLSPFFMSSIDSRMKSDSENLIKDFARLYGGSDKLSPLNNVGGLHLGEEDEATLFQFGLLSFLLPRYLFMLTGAEEMYDTPHSHWSKNNQLPCRIDTGAQYENWKSMQKDYLDPNGSSDNVKKKAFVIEHLPSQAVCARWMPNLKEIIIGGDEFYGVDTSEHQHPYLNGQKYDALPGGIDSHKWIRMFSKDGYDNSATYVLNGMTVIDGWGREFYYYSDAPYQSYRLWSAGTDGKTFPPWLMEHLDSYGSKAQETITGWTKDDVVHLAN